MAESPDSQRDFGKWVALAGAGFAIFVPIVVGSVLDHQFGWKNWGTLAGVVIGFVGGLSYLIAVLKRFQDPPKSRSADARGSPPDDAVDSPPDDAGGSLEAGEQP